MRKSEKIKQEADSEDNDLIAMGLYKKSLREGRIETFRESYLPQLLARYDVAEPNDNKFVIDTGAHYGIIDYFPKANKVCIRKEKNKWVTGGLNWIISNLI